MYLECAELGSQRSESQLAHQFLPSSPSQNSPSSPVPLPFCHLFFSSLFSFSQLVPLSHLGGFQYWFTLLVRPISLSSTLISSPLALNYYHPLRFPFTPPYHLCPLQTDHVIPSVVHSSAPHLVNALNDALDAPGWRTQGMKGKMCVFGAEQRGAMVRVTSWGIAIWHLLQ